jgi:hypothetical protein
VSADDFYTTRACACGREFERETHLVDSPPFDVCNRCFNGLYLEFFGDWGWLPIVSDLHARLIELAPDYRIAQIKEKFGGLRYYIDSVPEGVSDAVYAAIDEAEARSFVTCEVCGGAGEPRYGGWVKTLCDEHHEERERRRR